MREAAEFVFKIGGRVDFLAEGEQANRYGNSPKDLPDGKFTIKIIRVTSRPLSDADLEVLTHVPDVIAYDFGMSNLTNQGLASLKGMKELQVLNLYGTPIGDEGLKHLETLTGLKNLTLKRTAVTAAGVSALRKVLPNCSILRD